MRLGEILLDLMPDTLLRTGQLEWQLDEQFLRQGAVTGQHRRAARAPGRIGLAQRDLLSEQFVEGDALPVGALPARERLGIEARRRGVQRAHAYAEALQLQPRDQRRRQGFGEIGFGQCARDQLAQRRLPEAGGGRIDRRQRGG